MYIFGFIVAATLGGTAGSADLTDGMFRHLVVTGRSRLALYLARIPAGLAIIVPLVAVGLHHRLRGVCLRCADHAQLNGVNVPGNLSRAGFENWAADHRGRGHLQLQLQWTVLDRSRGQQRPVRQRPRRRAGGSRRAARAPAAATATQPAQIRPAPG